MAEDVKLDPYKTSKEILYKMKIDGPISEINEKKDDEDNLENSQNLMTISQFKLFINFFFFIFYIEKYWSNIK